MHNDQMPAIKRNNLTVLIDNFDSFTYNVYQFLSLSGANVQVFRNDAITLQELDVLNPTHLVISPGPGNPSGAGISCAVIKHFSGRVPILGVCLGEQSIFEVFGGSVGHAGEIVHGKTSYISHDSKGLYAGITRPFKVTRYHSLAGDPATLPESLIVSSTCDTLDGNGTVIMGVRHREYAVEGVQFHPESVGSEEGLRIVANFLSWNGGTWDRLDASPVVVSQPGIVSIIDRPVTSRLSSNKVGQGLDISELSLDTTKKRTSVLLKIKAERMEASLINQSLPGLSFLHLQRQYALGIAPPIQSLVVELNSVSGLAVFAEIKRASPSRGDISPLACAPSTALVYANAGASVISVLTEERYFKGSLRDLSLVRTLFKEKRPCVLRKDFIVDRYMVLESRIAGADCILLIVAMLKKDVLIDLIGYTRNLGMEPLVEVVSESEMRVACEAGASIVGVNNRNLHSFEVDMSKTGRVARGKTEGVKIIALSGVKSREDVVGFGQVDGVLVGEALMRADDPEVFIRQLKGLNEVDSARDKKVVKKICGISNVEDAIHAVESGSDMIGLIFAGVSQRRVSLEKAGSIVEGVRKRFGKGQGGWTVPFDNGTCTSTDWYERTRIMLESMLRTSRPLIVGVFTSESSISEINHITTTIGLDLIQLHGEGCPDARYMMLPVIKAVSVGGDDVSEVVRDGVGSVIMLLFDGMKGGSGKVWDWSPSTGLGVPFILAGGLNAENVAEGVKKVGAWGVDVAGGVERSKGIKDAERVVEFCRVVGELER